MTEPLSADRVSELLTELCRLVAERAPAEAAIPTAFDARTEATRRKHDSDRQEVIQHHEQQKAANEAEDASGRREIVEQFEADHQATEQQYEDVRAEIVARFDESEESARQELQEARWEATTLAEASRDGTGVELKEIKQQIKDQWEQLLAAHEDAVEVLQKRWQWREYPKPEPARLPAHGDPIRFMAESAARTAGQVQALSNQPLARLFEGIQPLVLVGAFCLVAIVSSGLLLGGDSWLWILASVVGTIVLMAVVGGWLFHLARRQSERAYLSLRQFLADANFARPLALKAAQENCGRRNAAIIEQRDSELKKLDEQFSAVLDDLHWRREIELSRADEKYPALLAEIVARRERELERTDKEFSRRKAEIEQTYREESERIDERHDESMREIDDQRRQQWGEMHQRWRSGMAQFQAAVDQMNLACDDLFPDWNSHDWDRWTSPGEVPPAIRFGRYDVKLDRIEHGVPAHDELVPEQTEVLMPALLPFPDRSLLMLQTEGEGRAAAVEVIQSVMLRILTAMPPGKIRFTIVDPVALGENFSAFMHLADYDEQLVASRIWTDNAHIEQRLGDLTEHMENIIQVYLRNEFGSIQEYNRHAGEMAEPYRVLVIANFPANFTEAAAQRLQSIVASGARCGVFTLLSVDRKLKAPRHFDLANLEPHALQLRWDEGEFRWNHPDFGELSLSFDAPPPAEQFTEIVRRVGAEVQDADRVEVPFECVEPDDGQWWAADSREGIDVPLGRAGAMKLQHLRLGHGTSQHVLVSGKTGSGKSTMLHALITNLALRYGPDEVELYLVDFKKGVEFKAYAGRGLPHARVIAIESEREFGLSVLERLDTELKRRGDLFRKRRVQNVKGFREAEPDAAMPRVLLIIDEFQELFVEDDRLAQDAALLLDRLVRQGRAFGIHVLLGSQTLGGAYSLARSTIGQMAVRIALQCSESDAHLILSEDNTAARLLTRPGEAIYNDANGLYEGNHPFQVAWLPDYQRDDYLQRIAALARDRQVERAAPIVFEGNLPADPSRNLLLDELLSAAHWPEPGSSVRAWLGSAVAIKDPTAAVFVRQSGSNLLLVGHREEAALGVLATSVVSLAAQHAPAKPDAAGPGASFCVFDGTRPDAPEAGFWDRLASVVPHPVTVVTPRDVPEAMSRLAAELARRMEGSLENASAIYLVIYNLGRFRELRKAEDEFSFSRLDENKPPSPAKQLLDILREGPGFGIHTLIWCDTYNNVARALDRQNLRELEMRVLFHMNATDSSNLIDSPLASRLGIHRALLYDEGQEVLEKFRPYGPPDDAWLDRVKQRLHDHEGPITERNCSAP